MNSSKLIDLIKTFSAKDFRQFDNFLRSPYFNYNEELILLYEYIRKCAPRFKLEKLERIMVYKSIFPKKKYDEKHIGYLQSFLLKQAETYIGIEVYKQNEILQTIHTLQSCLKRDVERHFNYIYQLESRKYEIHKNNDENYWLNEFLLSDIRYKQFQKQNIRKHDESLQEVSNRFDEYFIYHKLKYTCDMINTQRGSGKKYDLKFIDEVEAFLQNEKKIHIVIQIYFQIYLSLKNDASEDIFFKSKRLYFKHFEQIPTIDKKEILLHLNNYCARKVNSGNEKFLHELWESYHFNIEKQILFEDNYLSQFAFKNQVSIGLKMKLFEETEKIIIKNSQLLSPEQIDNAMNFNLALSKYYQEDYESALPLFHKVSFNDIFYNLDTKHLVARIYLRLKEYEALQYHLHAFKTYLKRTTDVSNETKQLYYKQIEDIERQMKKPKNEIATK